MGRTKKSDRRQPLATTEARRELPRLVHEMANKETPSKNLLDDAVEIGPHRKGGAILLATVDAVAHAEELAELKLRVDELEEDLEDVGMALFVQDRLARTSGERLSSEEFLRGIGMEDHVELLPRR